MANLNYVQSGTLYLAGSGTIVGATSIVLTSLADIYGNVLTMADFGTKGYVTLEPDTSNEEAATFTGVVANANGTYTLTGVATALAKSLYTETSGLVRQHSGGSKLVVTDNVAWWNTFGNKQNDEALVGRWTTPVTPVNPNDLVNKNYVDGSVVSGASDASTTVKGVSRLSSSPNGTPTPLTSISNASPAVFTLTAHGLTLNDSIVLTTTGTLPTGLSLATKYFVIAAGLTANAFEVSATLGGAAINTTGAGSGTHSFTLTTPVAVGQFDTRLPTAGQAAALAGTSGTPGAGNKYVTNADTSGSGAVVRNSLLSSLLGGSATFTAGSAITAGQPLHITPFGQIDGGILLDTQGAAAFGNTTNQSQSVTVASNSNRVFLVGVTASSVPTTVAYAGTNMTLVDSQVTASGFTLYVYKLVAPTTGANNIVVTATGIAGIAWASYYNVNQGAFIEASAKATIASVGGYSVSITTLTGGAFVHAFGADNHNSGSATSGSGSITTKYSSSSTIPAVYGGNNLNPIVTVSGGVFNETLSTTVSAGFGGSAGSGASSIIALSLVPATAQSICVVPTNSNTIINNQPLIDFIGIATQTVAISASVSVTILGTASGLSGLTQGKKVYLNDASGTYSHTRGTYGKIIGVALSATTMLIAPEKTMGGVIAKVATYTYTSETDGFVQSTGNATTTIGGVAYQGVASGTMTIPISKGNTYIYSAGTNLYFVPLA